MDSLQQPDFTSFLAALTRQLELHRLPFMLIGGQAVLLHGNPRLTEDIDITLGRGPEHLKAVQSVCTELGLNPLIEDVESFVSETFVLPVRHDQTGMRVDFIFSTTPYEQQAIERAKKVSFSNTNVPFASAEDLIIHKLFAGRARDIEDARGVARKQAGKLDWSYIEQWANAFAEIPGRENMPESVKELQRETEL